MRVATETTDGKLRSTWARWGSTIVSLAAILFTGVFSVACGRSDSLDGAWQPDNYGTRVEIAGDKIVILWRSAPVLETKFTVSQEGRKKVLKLEKTEMWDTARGHAVGTVTGCYVEDGRMHLLQHYEFAGDDEEILEPTTESRYGDAKLVTDKMMPRLKGTWKSSDRGGCTLKIDGGSLKWKFGEDEWRGPVDIVVVHYNWKDDKDDCSIVDKDASQEYVGDFQAVEFKKGKLTARIHVHDGDAIKYAFEKVE